MILRLLVCLSAILAACSALGADGPLRFGMELELSVAHFSKLTGLFDFARLQRDVPVKPDALPADLFDDYLRDQPAALATLPEEVRAELTRGLKLASVVEKKEIPLELKKPAILLSGVNGAATSPIPAKKGGLILPDSAAPRGGAEAPALPKDLARPVMNEKEGLAVPARLDWEELYRRWKALPAEKKASLVQWDKLGPDKKARLTIAILPEDKTQRLPLHVRSDAPVEAQKLFSRLDLGRDGTNVVEFRHRNDVIIRDPEKFLDDVRSLSCLAGVESKVFRPDESRLKGVSFHYHVSREGQNIEPVTKAYNRLLLAERITAGETGDLSRRGTYVFDQVNGRGLVRLVDNDRMEQRAHRGKLEDEFRRQRELLAMPEEDALSAIQSDLKKVFTPELKDRFVRFNGALFEKEFPEFYDRAAARANEARAARIAKLEKLVGDPARAPALWRRMPSLLKDARERGLQELALGILKETTTPWPASFWAEVPRLLGEISDFTTKWELRLAVASRPRPPGTLDRILAQAKALPDAEARDRLLQAAFMLGDDWFEKGDEALRLLRDPSLSPALRRELAETVGPKLVSDAQKKVLSTALADPELAEHQGAIIGAFLGEGKIPQEAWAAATKFTVETAEHDASYWRLFSSLRDDVELPPDFWRGLFEAYPKAAFDNQQTLRELVFRAAPPPDEVWAYAHEVLKRPGAPNPFARQLVVSHTRAIPRERIGDFRALAAEGKLNAFDLAEWRDPRPWGARIKEALRNRCSRWFSRVRQAPARERGGRPLR